MYNEDDEDNRGGRPLWKLSFGSPPDPFPEPRWWETGTTIPISQSKAPRRRAVLNVFWGDEGRHSSMKRDSKPAGWAEAGLLISGLLGEEGECAEPGIPDATKAATQSWLAGHVGQLARWPREGRGVRGRGGASPEGRRYNSAALPGSRANEIPSISLACSAVQLHLRTCGPAQ